MGMEKARKGHFLQVFVCVEVTERMMFMHSTGISIINSEAAYNLMPRIILLNVGCLLGAQRVDINA